MADDAPETDLEKKLLEKGYRPAGWYDVLDQCKFYDRKTKQHVSLDRNRLEGIAQRRNQLVNGRQSVAHYCLGHTEDGAKEWDQPPTVALMTRWRVGQYEDGTPNLEAYSWENPGHHGVLDEYKQRSAELWLDPDDVNPVALLKSTTPRRDLSLRLAKDFDAGAATSTGGLVRFWRHDEDPGRRPILFTMGGHMDPKKVKCEEPDPAVSAPPPDDDSTPGDAAGTTSPPDPDDENIEKIKNSDWGKSMDAKLDKISQALDKLMPIFEELENEALSEQGGAPGGAPPGAGGPPPGAGAPPGAGGPPPQAMPPEAAEPGGPPDDGGAPPEPDKNGPPNKKNSAYASPGYGATYLPDNRFARSPYPDYPMHDPETRVRMQRLEADLAETKKAKADQDKVLAAQANEIKALKLARVEAEVDVIINDLKRDGFKVVDEIDRPALVAMTPGNREKAVQFMRETRQKADVTPVPGDGKPVIDPKDVLVPVRFQADPGDGLPGDPALRPAGTPSRGYQDLAKIVAEGRSKGLSAQAAYQAAMSQQSNGTAVR